MDAGILMHVTAAAERASDACAAYQEAYDRYMVLRKKVVIQTQSLISLRQDQDRSGDTALRPHFEAIEAAIASDDVASREAEMVMAGLREDLERQRAFAQGGMRRFLSSYRRISTALDMNKQPGRRHEWRCGGRGTGKMPGFFTVLVGDHDSMNGTDELINSVNEACKEFYRSTDADTRV